MSLPLVTICIPTYRYGRYIGQAIESVLMQDFRDFELLIVDDASGDDTRQVVEKYSINDSRIIFEENPENRGMVPNWNYCLTRARGKYLKFLFADDFFCSVSALGEMINVMERNQDISLIFSARRFVDENADEIKAVFPFGTESRRISGHKLIKYSLARMNNQIGEPSTVLFRRAQALRGFDQRYKQLVDLEMWIYLLGQGDAFYLSEPLSAFRVHSAQQTTVNVRFLQDDRIMLARDYLGDGLLGRFIEYCQYYAWWKTASASSPEVISSVLSLIEKRYSLLIFRTLIPVYKLINPFYKYILTPIVFRV